MTLADGSIGRGKRVATPQKRQSILDAARFIFERDGLDGASLRGIAAQAKYTPAALYFHFDSKEALYAEVLGQSIASLQGFVDAAVAGAAAPEARFRAACLAFFDFYVERPRDLDLGFYLFRGGMRPHGLGRARDQVLNEALEATLAPIREAALALGADLAEARIAMTDAFAHAVGLLLMLHTQRIRMFGVAPRDLMQRYVERELERLMPPQPKG